MEIMYNLLLFIFIFCIKKKGRINESFNKNFKINNLRRSIPYLNILPNIPIKANSKTIKSKF